MRFVAVGAIALAIALGTGGGGTPPAAGFYIAQTAAGSQDGSTCGNAQSAAYFNTAGNWGAGKAIAPGVTVGLCGTITSTLTAQGDGAAGSRITVQFQPGAKISQAVCGPCLVLTNRSYVTVDGGTDGVIEATANGTSLANHTTSTAITAQACNNCEIENLTVQNVYVIAPGDTFICASGCAIDNAGERCLDFSGHDWLIHNNTMHDASWCLYEAAAGSDGNNRIYGNNLYNFDHGWAITGGGPFGKLYFYGNHMHDMGLWDACSAGGHNCHHDGIHCFFGGTGEAFAGSYVYDNLFDGTVGSAATSWVYLEPNTGSACSDASSPWYLFNNYFTSSDQVPTNPYIGSSGAHPADTVIYNSTFSGPGQGHFGANQAACVYTVTTFENNAAGGCDQFLNGSANPKDYNAYANGTGAGNCFPTGGGTCTFATWQASSGSPDPHSVFNSGSAVGSNAAGVGTNLTSLCVGDLVPLCTTRLGAARPAAGAWNAGSDG